MVIISDTSPIVNLAAINKLDLIPLLFGKVYIPEAVYEEIVKKGAGQPGADEIQIASWIEIRSCSDQDILQKLLKVLDPGESEAIALAIELGIPNLLIDEKNGRDIALKYHLKPIGVLGILLEAKRLNFIPSVKASMDNLRKIAGFFIADPLYSEVLLLAGEND